MRHRIYKVLERPAVYLAVQKFFRMFGEKRLYDPLWNELFSSPVESVLEVGCGPLVFPPVAGRLMVGLDVNYQYVKDWSNTSEKKSVTQGCVASSNQLPFVNESFQELRAHTLFHHLPDTAVVESVREFHRCLKPGGRMVIQDGIWPRQAWRRPVAWLLRWLDRGEWMRTQDDLTEIIEQGCPGQWDVHRHTYSYLGLEILVLLYKKFPGHV